MIKALRWLFSKVLGLWSWLWGLALAPINWALNGIAKDARRHTKKVKLIKAPKEHHAKARRRAKDAW